MKLISRSAAGTTKGSNHSMALVRLIAAVVTALVATAFPFANAAYSQTQPGQDTLVISPPLEERTVNPGEQFSYKATLTNDSTRDRVVTATVENMMPRGNEGGADSSPDSGPQAIASWMTIAPSQATVKAGGRLEVEVTVKVPKDAGPGTRFGGLTLSAAPEAAGGGPAVAVRSEISSLLIATVSGPATHKVELTTFKTAKRFYQSGNVDLATVFSNKGNVVARPGGTITIKNIFGKTVATLPLESQRVMPTGDRQIKTTWQRSSMLFGPYKATLNWNSPNQTPQAKTVWFFGAPLAIVIPVVVVLLALVFLVWLPRKRLKRAMAAMRNPSSNE